MNYSSEEKLNVLSKLMTSEHIRYCPEIHQTYLELSNSVADYYRFLDKVAYNKKSEVISFLERFLDTIRFFACFPELTGKCCIGIKGRKDRLDEALMDSIFGKDTAKLCKRNKSVPMMVFPAEDNVIRVINNIGGESKLTEDEYKVSVSGLYDKDESMSIDVSQLAGMFVLSQEICFKNSAFIYLPRYASQATSEYYSRLTHFTDCMVVTCYDEPDMFIKSYERDFDWLKKIGYKRPIYAVINDTAVIDDVKGLLNKLELDAELLTEKQLIGKINEQYSKISKNYSFHEYFLSEKPDILWDLMEREKSIREKIRCIKGGIFNAKDDDLNHTLQQYNRTFDLRIQDTIEAISKNKKLVRTIYNNINQVRDALLKFAGIEDGYDEEKFLYPDRYMEWCQKSLIKSIRTGNKEIESYYTTKLKDVGYKNLFLIKLYKKKQSDIKDSDYNQYLSQLEKLEPNDFLTVYLGILCRDEINIQNIDSKLVKRFFKRYEDNEILIFKGEQKQKSCKYDAAANYYERAMKNGSKEAGKRLFNIYDHIKDDNNNYIYSLADNLVPEACYKLGLELYNKGISEGYEKESKRGIRYIGISASMQFERAAYFMAEYKYKQALLQNPDMELDINSELDGLKRLQLEFDKGINDIDLTNAYNLYKFCLDINKNNKTASDKVIYINAVRGFSATLESDLQGSDTPISKYIIGKMYYEKGGMTNLKKSLDYFKRAEKDGLKIQAEIADAETRIREIDEKRKQNKKNSQTTVVNTEYGEKRLCFISTAICTSLNKDDDCDELNTLRRYRDNILASEDGGQELIDEYYRIAPGIVENINKMSSCGTIYKDLYTEFLSTIVNEIKKGNYDLAKARYIKMVKGLQDRGF